MSMPPEPVTGFCSLPRSATIRVISAAMAAGSRPTADSICRKRGGVDVERLDVDGELVLAEGEVGVEPVGPLGEHARRRDHAPKSIGIHGRAA